MLTVNSKQAPQPLRPLQTPKAINDGRHWSARVQQDGSDDAKGLKRSLRRYRSHNVAPTPPSHSLLHGQSPTQVIHEAIEWGRPSIDLSYRSLDAVPEALASTQFMISANSGALKAHVSITLQSNRITALPGFLMKLSNLTVLNLWDNRLTELPPCWSGLESLETLLVGRNGLRWIPASLLKCPRLKRLGLFPNPLLQGAEGDIKQLLDDDAVVKVKEHKDVVSLVELALRCVAKETTAQERLKLQTWLPPSCNDALTRVTACDECDGVMTVPHASFIRWQTVLEMPATPVLFRLCSPNCTHRFRS